MSKHRILWQSSTVISGLPDYEKAIYEHGQKVLSHDFVLTVRGLSKGGSQIHFMAFDFLNNAQLFQAVEQAVKEGYEAVALGCFLDPILDELREVMDIPVLGLGEAAMLTACMLGKRFSVVTYTSENNTKRFRELIHKYGLSERAAPSTHFSISRAEIGSGFANPAPVVEGFKKAAIEAIRLGAEVILPGCGILNLILRTAGISQVENATVLDVSGTLMKMAEMMVTLNNVSGVKISRIGYYKSPPKETYDEVRKIYGLRE
jgi:allantoin racemase